MIKFYLTLCSMFLIYNANAEFNAGLDASAITIQYIMADPPLPKNKDKKGESAWAIKPGFITGDTQANYDHGGGATSDQSGSIKGATLGVAYSRAFNERWGLYGWLVGASLDGDFETRRNGQANPTIFSRDVKTNVLNLSAGANYQFKRKEIDGYSFSMFFGPYIPMYWYSQRYNDTADGFEADLESNETFIGLLIGARWDIDLGEKWGMQPFVVLGDTFGSNDFFNPFGDSGECRSYKVKNTVRGNFENANIGESDCGNRKEFLYDTMIGGLGLNLTYKPWDISTNLFSPFLNQLIFDIFYEDEDPDLFYLSFTWNID